MSCSSTQPLYGCLLHTIPQWICELDSPQESCIEEISVLQDKGFQRRNLLWRLLC